MKKMNRKIFAVLLILLTLVNASNLSVSAENGIISEECYADYVGAGEMAQYVDAESFKEYLSPKLWSCEEQIDISQFNIPFTDEALSSIADFIRNVMADHFHVEGGITAYGRNGSFSTLVISYSYTGDALKKARTEFEATVSEMISDIKGNDALSEVQKALLLHDRVALKCEYDYTYSHRSAYDALVQGVGVCEAYSRAYSVLLDRVGIKSEACVSIELNHMWNIVYIGGTPYHVDVTWDDPSWNVGERGVLGFVLHDNFLRSTEGMIETGHEAEDFTSTPTDTRYDDYFWKNSQASFVLLEGDIYYIDGSSSNIKKYGSEEAFYTVSDLWKASASSYWSGNFSKLSTDGKYLYFSLSKAVFRLDIEKREAEKIFEPSLSGYTLIYGMEYEDGYIKCDLNNSPPFGGGTTLSQVKYLVPKGKESEIVVSENAPFFKENGYMIGVSSQTTVAELLSMLENEDAVVCDKNGNLLGESELCTTGGIVMLAYDGDVIDDVVIVISGDVDGSGTVDATDYIRIKSVFLGKLSVRGEYFLAADVEEDGVLDATDFLRVKSYFLGLYNLYS